MTAAKFVNQLPEAPRGTRGSLTPLREELRANPGRWAEIGRFPMDKRTAATNRGQNVARGHNDLESITRTVGDEIVVFVRAKAVR